jgi:hypothetical protein
MRSFALLSECEHYRIDFQCYKTGSSKLSCGPTQIKGLKRAEAPGLTISRSSRVAGPQPRICHFWDFLSTSHRLAQCSDSFKLYRHVSTIQPCIQLFSHAFNYSAMHFTNPEAACKDIFHLASGAGVFFRRSEKWWIVISWRCISFSWRNC